MQISVGWLLLMATVGTGSSFLGGCTNFREHGGSTADAADGPSRVDASAGGANGATGGNAGHGSGGIAGVAGSSGGGPNATGGTAAGGSIGTGGGIGSGGGPATGGGLATGGGIGTGGQSPTGSGGMIGSGGTPATGGHASGGQPGSGGASTGGTPPATGGAGGTPVVCTGTQHLCSGVCVANSSTDSCGSSCSKCAPPAGATATCDGTSCGFDCGTMKKCAAAGVCVPATGCCTNADCPAMAGGQTGTCDSGTHACSYACPSPTQACTVGTTTTCIAAGACCKSADCAGACKTCSAAHACVAAVSIDDPNGRCAGTCDATGTCKSKRGQLCSTVAAGCASGSTCSPDGYCCDTACTGACQACDIQGSAGTCTNVNSGAPHSNHTACGTDPSCLGTCSNGQCAYAVKACGSGPMCSGTMSEVKQSMCSAGACMTPAPNACLAAYTCSGTGCLTKCTGTSTGCASGYHCNSGGACVLPLSAGQVCTAATDCSSNNCSACSGGNCTRECCTSATTCTCPQPNTFNILSNPGFDKNLNGWTITGGGQSWVGGDDATNCPGSGSMKIQTAGDTLFQQCAAILPNTVYHWGLQWKPDQTTNYGLDCLGYLFSGSCPDTMNIPTVNMPADQVITDLPPAGWSGYDPSNNGIASGPFDSGNFSQFLFRCSAQGTVQVDMAFVTPVNQNMY